MDFDSQCSNQSETLAGNITAIHEMIISVNEVPPTNPPVGTVDEASAEVLANLELALRHLEDASARIQAAAHAYGPTAAQGTGTATASAETASTDSSGSEVAA